MDDRMLTALLVVVGVPAILVGYILLVELLLRAAPARLAPRLRPYLWIAPAVAFLAVFLVYPAVDTIRRSFMDRRSEEYVGLANYEFLAGNDNARTAIFNNVLWMVFLTLGAVVIGLVVAVLVDRVRYETAAKTVVFLPMAISFVAAGVIWGFMYDFRPQVGILNAIATGLGASEPIQWIRGSNSVSNTMSLIGVGVWMQVGFAMVILSAGLKSISNDLMEAARIDGATEFQIFRKVTLPLLMPTIAVVSTAVIIIALKAFDIVYVMTNGAHGTEILANLMYKDLVRLPPHWGRASATAVILFVAIIPVMVLNVRRFRQQEAIR